MFQILVVEDDRALCQSVCAYLSGQGYETTGCQSAQDAYDAMYSRVFDLIVSDVMMPGTDGFEFASTVRALNQEIPILLMTSRDDLASKQRGFCIGIDDYMLQTPELPQAQRLAYAKVIGDTSQRLADLISNILRLGKLENQQIFPAFAEFDLSEQLCACLLAFEDAWEEKRLDIETAIEDGVRAYGDAQLLELVWNNLFSNAIKFTGCGGRVSVRLSQENGQAVVTVADTGCGFSADVVAHIFEKFYQGDTSHATQGSGLGLALVRRVVDIHGGEIAVSSALGRGSTFTVRIHQGGQ